MNKLLKHNIISYNIETPLQNPGLPVSYCNNL